MKWDADMTEDKMGIATLPKPSTVIVRPMAISEPSWLTHVKDLRRSVNVTIFQAISLVLVSPTFPGPRIGGMGNPWAERTTVAELKFERRKRLWRHTNKK